MNTSSVSSLNVRAESTRVIVDGESTEEVHSTIHCDDCDYFRNSPGLFKHHRYEHEQNRYFCVKCKFSENSMDQLV